MLLIAGVSSVSAQGTVEKKEGKSTKVEAPKKLEKKAATAAPELKNTSSTGGGTSTGGSLGNGNNNGGGGTSTGGTVGTGSSNSTAPKTETNTSGNKKKTLTKKKAPAVKAKDMDPANSDG